jgi:hypothetical protein
VSPVVVAEMNAIGPTLEVIRLTDLAGILGRGTAAAVSGVATVPIESPNPVRVPGPIYKEPALRTDAAKCFASLLRTAVQELRPTGTLRAYRRRLVAFISLFFGKDGRIVKQVMSTLTALSLTLSISASAIAAPTWKDISGVYACVGHDEHLGTYQEREDLRLEPMHHAGSSRGYRVTGSIDGKVAYTGEAIGIGKYFALNFQSTSDKADHGVTIGHAGFKDPITFDGVYFQAQYSGGNSGTIKCTRTAD